VPGLKLMKPLLQFIIEDDVYGAASATVMNEFGLKKLLLFSIVTSRADVLADNLDGGRSARI